MQSSDAHARQLMSDGLTPFDLTHMTEVIRGGYGSWYHAELLRCLHILMPHADAKNTARLEQAYPGSCAAYRLWYNDTDATTRIMTDAGLVTPEEISA